MEFLKASRRRNYLNEVLHIVLNIALAVMLFALVNAGSMFLAFLLVIVSKWRVIAVRPRYWWANMLANIVDITVSLGVVCLLYLAGTSSEYGMILQIVIAALYALWLVVIKPRSSQKGLTAQAGIGLFVGIWALLAFAHVIPDVSLVVIGAFIVGYGAARHVLVGREELDLSLMSMVFGLLAAEIVWVACYWTVAYGLAAFGDLQIPQGALFVLLAGFLALRLYDILKEKKSLRSAEAIIPSVFVAVVVVVLAVFFRTGSGII